MVNWSNSCGQRVLMKCGLFKKKLLALICLLGFCVACVGKHPAWEYMPDMVDSAAVKAYRNDRLRGNEPSVRPPVPGTIPRGFTPYKWAAGFAGAEQAAKALHNPLPRSVAVLAKGQVKYNTYCAPCHGATGQGDGGVVPKFPRPPSLTSDKVVEWTDGHVFHVITRGQNIMPGYASQVAPEERWAIVHYMRALQRAAHPTADDFKDVQRAASQSAGK